LAKPSGFGAWSAEEGQYDGGWIYTKWPIVTQSGLIDALNMS